MVVDSVSLAYNATQILRFRSMILSYLNFVVV